MRRARLLTLSALLSFNGGLVDVVCFFGLKGLLAAHITGNLATLCASIVLGTAGLVSKIAAVPEFMLIAACTHGVGRIFKARGWPAARLLLGVEVLLLALFLTLAVRFGPFDDPDSAAALLTALAAIAAMAVQNGVQRAHLPHVPPTTFMTGNATQASIDVVDLVLGGTADGAADPRLGSRLAHLALNLACFAAGCASAAIAFWQIGFWSVAITLPIVILAVRLSP